MKKHQDIRSGLFASCWFKSGVSEKQACSGHPVNALLYWDLAVWRPGQNLGLSVAFLESFLNCFLWCGGVQVFQWGRLLPSGSAIVMKHALFFNV